MKVLSPARQYIIGVGDFPFLAAYAVGFWLLHWAAKPWGGPAFFSLWYPAAGLRFALLWVGGARLTPWVILTELSVDWITGAVPLSGPNVVPEALSALRPGVAYGLAVAGVQKLAHEASSPLTTPPMPLGLAAVAAPTLGGLLILPLALARPDLPGTGIHVELIVSLSSFFVGDLLGILALAPPLVWLAGKFRSGRQQDMQAISFAATRAFVVDAVALALALLTTLLLYRVGLGLQPMPAMLAGSWIGLRHGRAAAWIAILAEVLLLLPYTAHEGGAAQRLAQHMSLASVVIVTWLAGSYADAQKIARVALERRDRLLFQAERLKTLRAMSVAIIHEISQPLSTLAIEARHLRARTADLQSDIAGSAELVDRKAHTLSEMVRRLRRFGGREVDQPSVVPVSVLLSSLRQIMEPELRSATGQLEIAPLQANPVVHGQEIELTQAMVNLVRNAVAACPGGIVSIMVHCDNNDVRVVFSNPSPTAGTANGQPAPGGMGVGLIIARTIVEAHGGWLVREDEPGRVRFVVRLPLIDPSQRPSES